MIDDRANGNRIGSVDGRAPARRRARRRLLAHPRGPSGRDDARRSRGGCDQGRGAGRRRHAQMGASRRRARPRHLLPGRQPQQAVGRPRPQGGRRPRAGEEPVRARRCRAGQLPARHARAVRARVRRRLGAESGRRLLRDQRLRRGRRTRPTRLRPARAGARRAHERDRAARCPLQGGRGARGRHRGLVREHRRARRAASARAGAARGSASRSTCST